MIYLKYLNLDNKIKILVDKRLSELKCLDIEPVLYYSVSKYLDRCTYTVVKGDVLFIFPKTNFGIDPIGKKSLKDEVIINNIIQIYGINSKQVERIFNEWKRERYIYAKMCDKAIEYWDYIALPMYGKESKDDEYNF